MTERQIEYQAYLQTTYWKEVSDLVKERAGHRCQVCNSSRMLEAHHRTYAHFKDEKNHLGDLTCLCRKCHGLYHGKSTGGGRQRLSREERIARKKERKRKWFFKRAAQLLQINAGHLESLGYAEVERRLLDRQQQKIERRAARRAMRISKMQAAINAAGL